MYMNKPQRIRDPLHNLIEFGTSELEYALWRIIQTASFQRLRRIKQLGFSEIVYPGATHTRFAHSLGVYHIAKKLLDKIEKSTEILGAQALIAALVHDVGHGPFSHAFEDVGKRLGLKMAKHEDVSDAIIRGYDIGEVLNDAFGGVYSSGVADIIKAPEPSKIYGAVVSSQFDADRLDYMQRDRLMTGTQLGGVDFTWLLSNLEIGEVPWGDETKRIGTKPTFILGPKAIYAAESYILSLFQLYPTVYYHKTTRGVEKLFTSLLTRLFSLVQNDDYCKTNLPSNHPLVLFAKEPESLEKALALDDTVIMGCLPLMSDAEDPLIKNFSERILQRKLFKCIDIRAQLHNRLYADDAINAEQAKIQEKIQEWTEANNNTDEPRILFDAGKRDPYKRLEEEGPLNRIMIKDFSGEVADISTHSKIIAAIQPFKFFRVYLAEDDGEAKDFVNSLLKDVKK